MEHAINYQIYPGKLQTALRTKLDDLQAQSVVQRLFDFDYTLWEDTPEEITNRLDWLTLPNTMPSQIDEIKDFVDEVIASGYKTAVLLGMGGSSLAPDVFKRVFVTKPGYLQLLVLDTTDAATVEATAQKLNFGETLFIISTKSGGTVETLSLFKYFYNQVSHSLEHTNTGAHFTAITEPGSHLEKLAADLNFRKTFLNNPNIGGRYSALSHFGMVPAALIGIDIQKFLGQAANMAKNAKTMSNDNLALEIGALMGAGGIKGVDKITFLSDENMDSLEDWIEQLIAESTGKNGKGILPVAGEAQPADLSTYSADRIFAITTLGENPALKKTAQVLIELGHPVIQISLADRIQLSGLMFAWKTATAIAGHIIQIHPFNQPNVEAAKKLAYKSVQTYKKTGELPESETISLSAEHIKNFLAPIKEGNYIALQAFVSPSGTTEKAFRKLQAKLRDKTQAAVTFGFGPRYLHSTGQLHKGDAGKGYFIQFRSQSGQDVAIPENAGETASFITFDVLKTAQAIGDAEALRQGNRPVLAIQLEGDIDAKINNLVEKL